MLSEKTNITVINYNSKLDQLMQELRDRVVLDTHDGVQQIREIRDEVYLDSLVCAGKVGLNQAKTCLDRTRMEILNDIIDWIDNSNPTTPPIFWLHGQAGRGKSAIAHTVALHARNLGNLGSCFCFSRVRQHEGLHTKLFPTIARNLADRNLRFRVTLAEAIASDSTLRDTDDIAEQWQKLIVDPLSQLQGLTRNIVVVIDALDESGGDITREEILDLFATQGTHLPGNIRILLTSRPLVDIGSTLGAKDHVLAKCLDDIDVELTTRDITFYITTKMKKWSDVFSGDDVGQLAVKSSGLFEWARLACDYLRPRVGVIPKERFSKIMSHSNDGSHLLDDMYTTFLKDLIQGSTEAPNRFRSVMRQILWLKESLSINAMDKMRCNFSQEHDHFSVGLILSYMAPLLTGTADSSVPVRPLHASFYDFLLDEKRSGQFFIDEGDVHHDLALASLRIMLTGLRFNICALPTSYLRNSDIVDLEQRVEENILPHLLYSCRFWAIHIRSARFTPDLAQHLNQFATGEQILFWMEALGVSGHIHEAYKAMILAEEWLQVR